MLTPAKQASYHAGCAGRHSARAALALWHGYGVVRALVVAAAIIALGWLTGCASAPVTPPANGTLLTPIEREAEALRNAAEEAVRAQAAKDSRLAASSEVIERQNEQAPESPQKPVIRSEVGLLRQILNVSPSAEDRAAAAERESLMLAGRLEEARAKYNQASSAAEKLNAQIATANAQRDAAQIALANAIADAGRKLAEQQAQHTDDMAKLKASHERQLAEMQDRIRREQVGWWNKIGFGCEASALLCICLGFAFGGLPALRRLGPVALFLSACGFACFAVARVLGHPLFMPVTLSILGALGVWVGVWLVRHYRQGNLKAEAETRAAKLAAVARDVIPALDQVYDAGNETLEDLKARGIATVRDLLDSKLFSELSAKMDKSTKATVHEIRAEAAKHVVQ